MGAASNIESLLDGGPVLRASLERAQREGFLGGFRQGRQASTELPEQLLEHAIGRIEEEKQRFSELRDRRRIFRQLSTHAISPVERRKLLLRTARELGSRGRQLRGDARALSRWFDEATILERFERAIGETQLRLVYLCRQLGALLARRLKPLSQPARVSLWEKTAVEELLRDLLEPEWDVRVGVAALTAWRVAVETWPGELRKTAFSSPLRQRLTRLAQDRRDSVWRQIAALELLAAVDADLLRIIAQQKLATPAAGDDLFVRQHTVRLIGARLGDSDDLASVLGLATSDPSPFVRQAVARQLGGLPIDFAADYWLDLAQDEAREVRGAAFDALPHLVRNHDLALWLGSCVRQVLPQEADPTIARIGVEALVASYVALRGEPQIAEDWHGDAMKLLAELSRGADSTALRRWAASAVERLWLLATPAARDLAERLKKDGLLPRPGRSRPLPRSFFGGLDDQTIGRVLAVLAQDDLPLDLERGRRRDRLTRGFRFRFRLWRWLHELRNPAPDKRQAFRHTIGRVHYGQIRAPSERVAELAETKVPGEPLYVAAEDGWRPFLPLLDDCLSVLNQPLPGKPFRFYTSQGVTELTPPPTLRQRLRAYTRICTRFAEIARLRNWTEGGSGRPNAYTTALVEMGFGVHFEEHRRTAVETGSSDRPVDETVRRHFPALAVVAPPELLRGFLDYSLSLYENTLFDLGLFAAILALFFVGRHAWSNVTLRRARRRLGVVVGGWGTRGKSSVERLKAGLFNALGHALVSKTTGCEAMILYAPAFGEMRELFLFRPYDKATIWEQRNVTRIASELDSSVLLWECMGLTPAYVDVLQRQWMCDDLSTLTNTYPDHEDLQGPAGINIPMVMTLFIPMRSRLLSTEEQMRPILAEAARQRDTDASFLGWKEATLIPRDILARFPYEEHPYNIALVARLAAELGVSEAFAFKEMADRVVPDLGVLKTYPLAQVSGCRIEFSNGMSANERHGCLSNWKRLGLDRYDPETAGRWTTTLVNNRADRIPRSKVFAQILVADVSADRHVLIGGNLSGLVGYIDDAWTQWVAGVTLWPEGDDRSPVEVLDSYAVRFRQPLDRAGVERRLAVMLGEADAERAGEVLAAAGDRQACRRLLAAGDLAEERIDSLLTHLVADLEALTELGGLRKKAEGGAAKDSLDAEVRAVLRRWFDEKIVVIEDYYATGDQIVQRIVDETPPGFRNHVVGIQNIKGTGLDFVYRWLAWERCHRACSKILEGGPREATEGVEELTAFREFGPLSEERVRRAIAAGRDDPRLIGGQLAELDTIEAELNAQLMRARTSGDSGKPRGLTGRLLVPFLGHVEDLLDAGDAIRRRKQADQIFRDLVDQRVAVPVAIQLLQELTKRQKGGWLMKKLRATALFARLFS